MAYTAPKPRKSLRDLEYPPLPLPPLCRIIREGTIGDCPHCGSTSIKRWVWFGKIIGCINPSCSNYYYK
jgi:hypothetical protein